MKLKDIFIVTRSWSLSITFISVTIGTVLALGEPTVFLAFGPLMIEGAYAVQRATVSWRTFYVSLPIGLLVSLILLANNLRDIEFDARSGIKTLCTILGHNKALRLYRILSVLPFVLVFIYILFRILSWPALLVFLSFPSTIRVNKDFMDEIPASSDARTSQLSLLFGLLLIAALILE